MTGATALALLVLTPKALGAAGQERAFQKVSSSHWVYASVRRLEKDELYTGSPPGTFNGVRARTRYEFAVAVERIYRSLQPRVLAASQPGNLPEDLRELRRLLDEFGPDIAALQQDVTEMRRQVEAMERRLVSLSATAGGSSETPQGLPGSSDPTRKLRSLRLPGLLRALDRTSGSDPLEQLTRGLDLSPPLGPIVKPGLAASLGPAILGVEMQASDRLTTPGHALFQSNAALANYKAQLSMPYGPISISAVYHSLGVLSDPYNLRPQVYRMGPAQGFGGAVSGLLGSERAAFRLETASLRAADDDLVRLLILRGDFRYMFGGGLSLQLGYERSWLSGLSAQALDGTAYTMGIGQSFGRNARLDFLLRYDIAAKGPGDAGGARDLGNSSAITQISVKF